MRYLRTEIKVEERKINLNMGDRECFTEQEKTDYYSGRIKEMTGCYSYEVTVFYYSHNSYLTADREYVEHKLGLREVLTIMKKLSKGDTGALSKQLFPYYKKLGVCRLKPDFESVYKKIDFVDLENLNNRQSHYSHVYIKIGSKTYFGSGDGLDALEDITMSHLKRCISILVKTGYIITSNTRKDRRLKGYDYTYSNTYYKLTEKAERLLSGVRG